MLALHHSLLVVKLWLVLFVLFDLKKPKYLLRANGLVVLVLVVADFWRFSRFGFHPILGYDMFIGITLALGILFFLTKKITLIFIGTNILVFNSLIATIQSGILSIFLQIEIGLRSTEVSYSLFNSTFGLISISLLCWLAKKSRISLDFENVKILKSLLVLVLLFGYGLSVNLLFRLGSESDSNRIILLIGLLFSYVPIIIMFGYATIQSLLIRLKVEKEMNAELYEKKEQLFKLVTTQNQEILNLNHDNKNHYITINSLAKSIENDKIIKYTERLIETAVNTEEMTGFRTGSVIVDIHLHQLASEYSHLDIELEVNGFFPADFQMEEWDATILFANIFSNAFEATSKVKGEKYIKIQIRENDPFLYILVENNFDGVVQKQGEYFKSVKADKKRHGFGIGKIKEIVGNYGGDVEFHVDGNKFGVEIVLTKSGF